MFMWKLHGIYLYCIKWNGQIREDNVIIGYSAEITVIKKENEVRICT